MQCAASQQLNLRAARYHTKKSAAAAARFLTVSNRKKARSSATVRAQLLEFILVSLTIMSLRSQTRLKIGRAIATTFFVALSGPDLPYAGSTEPFDEMKVSS